MDAISMLKADHKTVEQLFKRFERAGTRAHSDKRDLVDRVIEALSVHAAIEEQLFYPVARATVPGVEDIALESLEEHHIVKWVLSELETMNPEDERFDAKVSVLIENVRHHVKEEEANFFPMVRGELGRNALSDLGDAMAKAKKLAPTNPHPRSPDEPPCNVVVGTAAGVADRIGDTMSGLAQGGVTAAGDIIAAVLRHPKPRVAPTGSTVARKTAAEVRTGDSKVSDAAVHATGKAKRTARTARKTGTSTASRAKRPGNRRRVTAPSAQAAKANGNGSATTARKSIKRATTTAKRGAATTARKARATKATARRSIRKAVSSARSA
jgi:hemerythrin-like domain-containing protein